MKKNECNSLIYYQFNNLLSYQQIVHGAFTRLGGVSDSPHSSLNTSYGVNDRPENIKSNLERICSCLGIGLQQLVTCNIEHGDQVIVIDSKNRKSLMSYTLRNRELLPTADAMITKEANCFLHISSADCAIVLIYDSITQAIGIVHAGWKGIFKELVKKSIMQMKLEFGSSPESLLIGVTPSIGPCCYRIGNPLQKAFPRWENYLQDLDDGKTAIDLRSALYDQLKESGIIHQNIEIDCTCTSCSKQLFFSNWAEKPKTGRMATVIGLSSDRE